jgi:VanZ family protein
LSRSSPSAPEGTTVVAKYATVAAIMVAVIVYGSLYPFRFETPAGHAGAVATLLHTWNSMPGRGDFLANVLLYIPLGFFGALALGRSTWWARAAVVTLFGLTLSAGVELTQYFDPGRDPSMTDVYSNALGTMLGAAGGLVIGVPARWPLQSAIRENQAPALLLIAWLGFRLYPYVPTIDLHKYWDALKPIILTPTLPPYDLFRYTIMWIAVGTLVEATVGRRRWWLSFPLFVGFVLIARILMLDIRLSVAELAGAALAYMLWLLLSDGRSRARLLAAGALLSVLVIVMRLQPFRFSYSPGSFGWIPFASFLSGSIAINVQSFLEKFFYYGTMIWLLGEGGFRLAGGTVLAITILFTTSLIEVFLPGRSAEITDAVMALMAGIIFALVRRKPERVTIKPSMHR